ncbi:toxin MIT1-like [Littorina saxatilis]|uniref:Prokineticin domain-containing protein n=1 Tax=Littorina saxatilis TaxID=31220 RepID=A0AAN9BPU4_9CAEN
MNAFLISLVLCVGVCLCCEKGSDCADNECCVITDHGSQVCQPFIREGDECHMLSGRNPFEKPDFPVTECICAMGTQCVPDNPNKLGSTGKCQLLLLS